MNLQTRLERTEDISRVDEIVREAFGDEATPRLLEALRASDAWRDLSFVATVDDLVVGHLALTRGWIDAPEKLVEVLVMSPVAVHPDWQGRGIGTQMLIDTLQLLASRAEPAVFLEGNPRVYRRAGFKPAVEAGFTAPSVRIPLPAFQFFPLPNYEPSLRGALVYPDVFWKHDAVGLRPAR